LTTKWGLASGMCLVAVVSERSLYYQDFNAIAAIYPFIKTTYPCAFDEVIMNKISQPIHSKKILFIITGGESGGAQTHLFDLCSNLDQMFIPLVAIGSPESLGDRLKSSGIAVYEVPSLQRQINLFQDFRTYHVLQDLINRLQPDLICAHSSKAGFLSRAAARRCKVPSIFTAHGWAFTEGVPFLKRLMYRRLEWLAGRWCDKIICVSEYDVRLALKARIAQPEKLTSIHNGLPPAPFGLANGAHSEVPRIIMVARFSAQKDYPLLLKAIRDLGSNIPFKVDLVGDGPLLGSTIELASRLNILDKVNFLGDRADVPTLLNNSDIFVLTSNWEGFPISILEAMRAGLPVIASDVGGCNEAVINGSTGFLVPAGDLKSLINSLHTLLIDQDLRTRLGQTGHNFYLENFTINKMVEKTMHVYEQVLNISH